MRKKLDTRFPAARIKKIMQADEDVGKIAMAVPLLVSKALELFLQDLCDRTYGITLQRGAKTLNSMHLKQCVQSFNVFDFLRDIVGKVPDLGGSTSDAAGEDRSATKRRKLADDEHNDVDDDSKRDKPPETPHANGGGRGRISRAEREANATISTHEFGPDKTSPNQVRDPIQDSDSKENVIQIGLTEDPVKVRNFDLNLELDENGDTPAVSPTPVTPTGFPPRLAVERKPEMRPEMKPDEYLGWSLAGVDPSQLANLNSRVDDEDEDYDEEG